MSEFKQTQVRVDLTRRQWLLKLSQLVAVAGFSGLVPELAPALPHAEGQETRALPPGLYYPSEKHLSHALGDRGSRPSIPPGSETDYVKPSSSPFRPQFFSDEEFRSVTRFAEILLGKVDRGALAQSLEWLDLYLYSQAGVRQAALNLDPLHRALAVAYHGESGVRELETRDAQTVVRSGMAALERLSMAGYGHRFVQIDESQQTEILTTISAAQPDSSLRRFFETMRAEIVRGYYTSAEGLQELDYKGNWYYTACPACERK